MKILYIVPDLNSWGGIQRFAKDQLSLLKTSNLDSLNWINPVRLRNEIIIRYLPRKFAMKYFYQINNRALNKSIDLDSYDIVHFWHIEAAMAFPNVKRSIICCYGLEILEANVKHCYRPSFLQALHDSSAIVACSTFTKKYLIDHYNVLSTKIKVIPPGIDLNLFTINPHIFKKKRVIIGTLSRLVKRKNIANIIKSLVILKDIYSVDFVYYLAGTGPEQENIMHALKSSEIEYKYFGKISDKDKVDKFYPKLDVFVLPPLETSDDVEGFGIVFLEANACGIPVVAASNGGVSDAVRENVSGVFANPKSPEDIAAKVHEIIMSTNDYRNNSRKWAEKFNQEKAANQFLSLYKKVIGQPDDY